LYRFISWSSMFNDLKFDMFTRFIDVGEIFYHHRLIVLISSLLICPGDLSVTTYLHIRSWSFPLIYQLQSTYFFAVRLFRCFFFLFSISVWKLNKWSVFLFFCQLIYIGHRWQFSPTCRILSLMTSQVIATFVYVTHSQSVNTLKHYNDCF
jgi:hypothetical protein